MNKASLQTFALAVGFIAVACAPEASPEDDLDPGVGGTSMGGTGAAGAGGTTGGTTGGGTTGGNGVGGAMTGGAGGVSTGGVGTGGVGTGGVGTGGIGTGGAGTGGVGPGGVGTGGAGTGGVGTGGAGTGGVGTGGAGTGGVGTGGAGTGGMGTGGMGTGGATGGMGTGGSGGAGTGGTSGKGGSGGAGAGGSAGKGGSGGATGGAGSGGGGAPNCNAALPSGAVQHSGNGTGGQGNLAWEIWSNTGQGQLTTYSSPAFIATWNNSGGYLGRLGFEWNRFGDTPVPHTQRGTISAQFASKKTGSAGGYSYIGMYGWTTTPCVEWYVVDDSFNTMPINPGMTTNKGERTIDGGTYVIYTRPTTGSGGSRCSNTTDWIQYYSVRKTARACGVISLSQHFTAWQSLGMDMTGPLLEAKVLVEVGGGVGNVELPIANVTVQ